jgi:hypothetical protein
MSIEDKMNIDERRRYLFKMQGRYKKANRLPSFLFNISSHHVLGLLVFFGV